MEVTSGARWSTTVGQREWLVGLNENDGAQLFPEWKSWSWGTRMQNLQKRADILVVKYMLENDAITLDYAKQRIKEIQHDGD